MITSPPALSKSAKRKIAQQKTARNRKWKPLLYLDLVIACCLFTLPALRPDVGAPVDPLRLSFNAHLHIIHHDCNCY